jgi:hypothetical protein
VDIKGMTVSINGVSGGIGERLAASPVLVGHSIAGTLLTGMARGSVVRAT